MIFKRREKPSLLYRIREFFAPRKGFWRGMDYIGKRMRRLPDSPHRIALGFACGAVASFTPFFGFHFFVAAGIAWVLRANIVASLFGTIVGNPLTFPFISGMSRSLSTTSTSRCCKRYNASEPFEADATQCMPGVSANKRCSPSRMI